VEDAGGWEGEIMSGIADHVFTSPVTDDGKYPVATVPSYFIYTKCCHPKTLWLITSKQILCITAAYVPCRPVKTVPRKRM